MDWIYNNERIRLNGYKIELYDKYGYVNDKILWREDLDADDWEVYDEEGVQMIENKMKFKLGKYYKHSTGKMMFICGVCSTHDYGMCLMAEDAYGSFCPVGNHEGASDNWCEITEEEFLHGRE